MQIDELKSELTTLAAEIEPFEANVGALHRRERRRRVITSSLTAALAVVVAVAAIAALHYGTSGRVQVTGAASKEVPAAQITNIAVVVVPASPQVEALLDASPLVVHYAAAPQGDRRGLLVPPDQGLCALESSGGFAVEAVTPGPHFRDELAALLAGQARVYDVSDEFGFDLEVFMRVTAAENDSLSVRSRLTHDPDVSSFEYVTHADAYDIVKNDFSDQPDLVDSIKPADLPESFLIDVKPGASAKTVADRYHEAVGVDTTITQGTTRLAMLFDPSALPKGGSQAVDACRAP